MIPYDEQFHLTRTGPTLAADYREFNRHVGDDDAWVVWPARIDRDVCEAGITYEASLAKHRAEWRAKLAPQPAPGPTPVTWRPVETEIRHFRGAFCVPDAWPGIRFGDGARLWTPAFLCYTDAEQDEFIRRYKAANPLYSHMVINLGGTTYHNDYPELPDDPAGARRGIVRLLNAHLIPVCCATNDNEPDRVLDAYRQNADLIDCSFVMWEMNGPCQGDSDRMFAITKAVREAAQKAKTYIHFTAGHGSMGEPEGEWWKKCAAIGIMGLFSQDDHWDDAANAAAGLEDTAAHLHGQRAGWEGLNLDNVAFEQTTTPVYHKYPGWDGAKQRAYGDYLLAHCPNIAGVMDGFNG